MITQPADGTAQRLLPGAAVSPVWWRLFHSTQLDTAIEAAMRDNPTLAAAQASLRASEADLRSGYGIFYPSLDAEAAATRERLSPAQLGQTGSGHVFNLFTLSASVNYALDLFGGQRRVVEALHAQTELARATEQAAYLTLSANIANTMIALAAYRAEIDATRQLIGLEQEQVHLAEVQVNAGTAPYSTMLTLRSQLASSEASVPALEQKRTQAEDLLAALAGRTPAEWRAPEMVLDSLTLPADLPVSLPAELVRQRPDILIAEATAHQASADVGVATAAMLPSVNLNAAAGGAGGALSGIVHADDRVWNMGASISAPLFEGGTLWFRRKAAMENYRQAMELYRQTVLGAFEQVADSLRALEHDAQTLAAEQRALDDARDALHLVQTSYQSGLATYLEVLSADSQFHQAQIAATQARASRFQDTVALFAALGGGWWNAPAPPAPDMPPATVH